MICPIPKEPLRHDDPPRPRLGVIQGHRPDRDDHILSGVLISKRRTWRSFSGSLALHAAILLAIPWIGEFAEWLEIDPNPMHLRIRSSVTIRVPEPLYAARSSKPSAVAPAQPRLPFAQPRVAAKPAPSEPERAAAPVRTPARRFELPVSAPKPKAAPVVLEPPSQNAAVPSRELPQVMFWARRSLAPPRPKALVLPGRSEASESKPVLAAPPSLELPNRQPTLADLNVGGAVPTVPHPALALPPSSTAPVRLLDAPAGQLQSGNIESSPGDAVNVIVLSPNHLPPGRLMTLPEPNPGGQPALSAKAQGKPGAAGASEGQPGGIASTAGGDAGFGDARDGGQFRAELPLALLPLLKIQSNGVADLVIVQSSLAESFPETKGMLTGKPVYSVYMHVGGGKDWILQYCEPNSRVEFQRDKDFVNLAGAVTVKAPYPRLILAPDVSSLGIAIYTIIHGLLSASGQLRELTLKRGPSMMKALLPMLDRWEFRPATKDGQPLEVEVLLAIPPGI